MKEVSPDLMRFLSTGFARELDVAIITACHGGVADELLSDVVGSDQLIREMKKWFDPQTTQ